MELKELFAEYEKANSVVEEKKLQYERAIYERSVACQAIAEAVAPKKKIIKGGKELTIVRRGDTYFFRGLGKSNDVVEIE